MRPGCLYQLSMVFSTSVELCVEMGSTVHFLHKVRGPTELRAAQAPPLRTLEFDDRAPQQVVRVEIINHAIELIVVLSGLTSERLLKGKVSPQYYEDYRNPTSESPNSQPEDSQALKSNIASRTAKATSNGSNT